MPPEQRIDLYASAMEVDVNRRLAGLAYVLERVAVTYPDAPVSLVNVARLVDHVAAAHVDRDGQALIVNGLRLLDLAELDHLVGILEGKV